MLTILIPLLARTALTSSINETLGFFSFGFSSTIGVSSFVSSNIPRGFSSLIV